MKIKQIETPRVVMSNKTSYHKYFAWPTVCRLKNGRIALGASGFRLSHVCPFGKSVMSVSEDEGNTWSLPAPVIDTVLYDRDVGLAAFGKSGLIFTSFNNTAEYQRGIIDKYKKSEQEGVYRSAYLDMVQKEDKTADYAAHIIAIPNKGFIAAVPHCYEQNFPAVSTSNETSRMSAFFEGLSEELQKMNKQQLPVVMMAHLTVAGCDLLGHDVNIGGMDSVDLTRLGKA